MRKLLSLCQLLIGIFVIDIAGAQTTDSLRVVFHQGTNMALALSPDKQTLVLDIQGTLWLLPVKGGVAKAITDEMGDCRQPSWSPDGTQIVFQSYRDGGWHLWTIHKDGSNLTQLTYGIYDDREPHWSADSKHIVFSSDRSGNNYDIWELDLTNSSLKQLTTDVKNDYNPVYSTDGSQIAFVSDRGSKPGIYIRTSEGQEKEVITPGASVVAAPTWSPDGKQLLFQVVDEGKSHLLMTTVAEKKYALFTLEDEDPFPFRAAWLSNEEVIYTSDGLIKKKNITKKKITPIVFEASVVLRRPPYMRKKYDFDTSTPQPVKGITGPVVSPDGTQVVFSALSDLWLLTIGKAQPTQLTKDVFTDIEPTWSPDGKQIAFLSDRMGSMDIWVRDLSTGQEKRLTSDSGNESLPTWSPDGKYIAYYANEANALSGGATLYKLEVATGKIEKLHAPLFAPSQPSWSGDGETIAVSALEVFSSRFREGVNKIFFISTKGKPDRHFMPMEGKTLATRGKNGPVWSPDGRWLAYVMDGILWALPVTPLGEPTGPPHRLTNELADSPSWTKDSQSLVFNATDVLKKVGLYNGIIETIPLDLTWKIESPAVRGEALRKVIHAGRLFDGKSNSYKTNVDIVVEGNRIKEIVPHAANQTGTLIDASDKTIIPGLFEMHTHQYASAGEKLGRTWLSYGITSVREPGADPYDAVERKEIWSSGASPGPREFFTGNLQDGNRVYYGIANSLTEAGTALEMNRSQKLGYDLVKTYVRMPDYLQKRLTAFAHQNGIPVSSHEIYPALSYGVDNIEHIGATSRRGYSPLRSARGYGYQDVVELVAKSGIHITPTAALYGGFNLLTLRDSTIFDNKQYVSIYSEDFRKTYRAYVKQMQSHIEPTKVMLYGFQKTIRAFVDAGSHITAGTDSPIMPYGLSIHLELQTFVDGGLTPYQALQAAGIWAAESLGVENDLGSIEPGKLADLVIVEGDPLKNIRDAWNVKKVMKNGLVYSIDDLLKKPKYE